MTIVADYVRQLARLASMGLSSAARVTFRAPPTVG